MTSHRQLMLNLAQAVRDSAAVRDFAVSNFSRGLAIHVGAYAHNELTEDDSPFLWIFADGDSESIDTDETFTVSCIVGGCPVGTDGEKVIVTEVTPRTATQNGLTVNGANKIVEDLRDLVLSTVRDATIGARVSRFTRSENDLAHQPLEWAAFQVDLTYDVSLEDKGE